MRSDLAAAAALPQLPRWQYLCYFAGALAVQFTWGLTAVATRYVQTRAPQPVPTLQLWVVASVIAWVGLLLFYSIPSAVQQQLLKRKAARQQGAASAASDANLADKQQQQQQQQEQQQQQQHHHHHHKWQRLRAAVRVAALSILIGTLLNMSAVGSAGAAKLVNAYVVQLLLLLTPLVCALCNMLVMRQPSPPKLLHAVLLSLAGGGMVLGGYWAQERQQAAGSSTAAPAQAKYVVLGVVVALLAMVGQALYFVLVQLTRTSLSAQQVLWGNRNVAFVVVLPLALAAEGTSWSWVAALRPSDWGAMVFIGIGVQTLGAMGMQWTTRAIGAAAVSSVSSLRLVASVVGSVLVLHETPTHPLVWCGFVLVVVAMWVYTAYQYKSQPVPQSGAAASTQQLARGSSCSSRNSNGDGQLPIHQTAGELGRQGGCSLQEDWRRAALLTAAGSDPSWQLFAPLVSNTAAKSACSDMPQPAASRTESVPVVMQQAAPSAAPPSDSWHLEGRHLEQRQQ
ncbi:hypothetical protein COO60DRAFT_498682 [Scenedesmus sp. NREL 46B-D3]|nr:hypothetical protein COO60DRAFT_498682 [Scenedesmus sp. NREL 46B-D3]